MVMSEVQIEIHEICSFGKLIRISLIIKEKEVKYYDNLEEATTWEIDNKRFKMESFAHKMRADMPEWVHKAIINCSLERYLDKYQIDKEEFERKNIPGSWFFNVGDYGNH